MDYTVYDFLALDAAPPIAMIFDLRIPTFIIFGLLLVAAWAFGLRITRSRKIPVLAAFGLMILIASPFEAVLLFVAGLFTSAFWSSSPARWRPGWPDAALGGVLVWTLMSTGYAFQEWKHAYPAEGMDRLSDFAPAGELSPEALADAKVEVIWYAPDDREQIRAIWRALTGDGGAALWTILNPDRPAKKPLRPKNGSVAEVRVPAERYTYRILCEYDGPNLHGVKIDMGGTWDVKKISGADHLPAVCPSHSDQTGKFVSSPSDYWEPKNHR